MSDHLPPSLGSDAPFSPPEFAPSQAGPPASHETEIPPRPWYKKKRWIISSGVLGLVLLGGILAPTPNDDEAAPTADTELATSTTSASADTTTTARAPTTTSSTSPPSTTPPVVVPFPALPDEFERFVTALGDSNLGSFEPLADTGIIAAKEDSGTVVGYLLNESGRIVATAVYAPRDPSETSFTIPAKLVAAAATSGLPLDEISDGVELFRVNVLEKLNTITSFATYEGGRPYFVMTVTAPDGGVLFVAQPPDSGPPPTDEFAGALAEFALSAAPEVPINSDSHRTLLFPSLFDRSRDDIIDILQKDTEIEAVDRYVYDPDTGVVTVELRSIWASSGRLEDAEWEITQLFTPLYDDGVWLLDDPEWAPQFELIVNNRASVSCDFEFMTELSDKRAGRSDFDSNCR